MINDDASNLPAKCDSDEVIVSLHDQGLLVGGDPAAVESYLARLRATGGRGLQVANVDAAAIGNATGLVAGLASAFLNSGRYVQLHPDSIDALKNGHRVPGTDGFYRMITRGDDGRFLTQLQWREVTRGPEAMLSAQMIAVQLALKSAIADVEEAIRRVEGKVESVLELARAGRAGDVLGNHLTISRMVGSLERYGSLPDAYWDSVAGLGPTLNVTVQQLRDHVRRILASFESQLPVQERAKKLRNAVNDKRLGETLSLLVVAEESLYRWQRLNLARIESTQPEHLLRAIDEARELVTFQLREDADIYQSAKEALDRFAKPEAIEGFRFLAVRELVKQRSSLSEELDRFAKARRHQVEAWEDFNIPKFLDAANAAIDTARTSTGRMLAAAGQEIARFRARLAEAPGAQGQPGEMQDPTTTTNPD
ncbi:hypothetical protein OCO_21460 [Mycobacterium intracellulare MOTT-02]|uniref:hypothetical protein n=1 Tax=Mycobacterium intracellulare TaxID=1767 RepID=UPI0002529711|nr:hypothetical protein [Mycobacterium intracellulare]AFC48509.1 hypothetical protein OCO_21460 [Mycobacterium intracellulare MOTT-02]MDM3894533.1 hypothetical protein [Mycobacterium intracellulare]